MEPHFADNCRSLTEKLHALREPDDLCFALLAGTAVSDFADHTDENIRAVDAQQLPASSTLPAATTMASATSATSARS